MRLHQPPTLLSLLLTILSTSHISNARPQNARDQELFESQYRYLDKRNCAGTVCGWSGQLCCTGGQTCSTNSQGQAECIGRAAEGTPQQNGNGNGQWQYFVTTYVESELTTVTSTYSSVFGAAGAPAATGISCDSSMNESPCGTICCAVGQYCAVAGQCAQSNSQGGSSSYFASIITTAAPSTATEFIRPTSNAETTVTSTGSVTTTVPFQTPSASATNVGSAAGMTSTTSNNGLSGGAIAGIVIGVLAGIILLLLLCFLCCFKGLFDGCLALLGIRNRKRRETTYIEERRHHHGSSGVAGGGRRWFGTGPSRVDRPKKKSSGLGGVTWVAGLLAALGICLGLQRRRNEKRQKSEYSGSSYSYTDSYTTSDSSESSFDSRDRRTARTDTRRSAR
ncbi:hypothetical protein ACLMJK_004134 [Lecanora helva]